MNEMTTQPRPARALIWAIGVFGPIAANPVERATRFIEEALELAQSIGVPAARAAAIHARVYARAPGFSTMEIGQAALTLELLAEAIGMNLDASADAELARVRAISNEEWQRRHDAKVRAGIAAACALNEAPADKPSASRDGPMMPCPYCGGPPAVIERFHDTAGNLIRAARIEESEDGLHATAFVFCHECGAQGPEARDIVFKAAHADLVRIQAKEEWNTRNARHRELYEAGVRAGLFGELGAESAKEPSDPGTEKLLRDLLDRMYKMNLLAIPSLRVMEFDPDSNDPLVAWMSDARKVLYGNLRLSPENDRVIAAVKAVTGQGGEQP
jgi:hypothetical protein